MWWKKENSIFPLALASLTVGLLVGGVWYWNEKRVQNPHTSKTNNLAQLTVLKAQEKTSITLLGDTFSGYSTFRSSEFTKALSEVGIDLKYEEEFDQAVRAERLNQNHADIYVTTLDQFLLQKPQGKIVGLVDRTVGADAVVLNTKKYPDLKSLQDLGKLEPQKYSITYAADTPSEYLALVLDTKFEAFKLSNFNLQPVSDASVAWQRLQNSDSNIAVAVLWEPYVSQAKKQGYTVAISSLDAPTAIVDVIVASDRIISSNPQVVSDFLEVYYRHLDRLHSRPQLLTEQIAADGKLSVAESSSVVSGIDFFTSVEAHQWMSNGTLTKRLGATAAVLALSGKIQEIPESFQSLYDSQFVAAAVKNTQKLIELVRADNPDLAEKLSGQGRENVRKIATTTEKTSLIGNLIVKGEIKFATESALLTAVGKQTISRLASEIQDFNPKTVAIRVIGHTSKTGSSAFNQILSDRRAQTVADALRFQGIKNKIIPVGKGDSQPLPGIPATDWRNQRTEIQLVRLK